MALFSHKPPHSTGIHDGRLAPVREDLRNSVSSFSSSKHHRIAPLTAGERPLTVQRHVSSGSSWGANPLQQHIGLGKADRVALVEVHWPTSGTTQVFRDIPSNQAIEVTESSGKYRTLDRKPMLVVD